MQERINTTSCERGSDLIAFLYGEVNESEARDFEKHLAQCAGCKNELNAFRGIRESVIDWRNESLGLTSARAVESIPTSPAVAVERKPSAMAAIRGFFDLSPLWMKVALTGVAVVFCVVAGLIFTGLREKPLQTPVATNKVYSEQELQSKVEDGVQAKLKQMNALKEASVAPVLVGQSKHSTSKRSGDLSKESAVYFPRTKRAPLTRSEREQLAADLRLIVPKDETNIDLLDGVNQ